MSKTQRTEAMERLAEEEAGREAAILRGDLLAARDCEEAYRELSRQLDTE